MPQQKSLFADTCEDLPIFSGTAVPVKPDVFRPQAQPRQLAMLCKFCHGTGLVAVKKTRPPVNCPACQERK